MAQPAGGSRTLSGAYLKGAEDYSQQLESLPGFEFAEEEVSVQALGFTGIFPEASEVITPTPPVAEVKKELCYAGAGQACLCGGEG